MAPQLEASKNVASTGQPLPAAAEKPIRSLSFQLKITTLQGGGFTLGEGRVSGELTKYSELSGGKQYAKMNPQNNYVLVFLELHQSPSI